MFNYKGQVLDILKKHIKAIPELQYCFDVISQGRMFSAEYKERTYQPIKFLNEEVETSMNSGAIQISKMKKSVFSHIDHAIHYTLDTTIQREEAKSIEENKSSEDLKSPR